MEILRSKFVLVASGATSCLALRSLSLFVLAVDEQSAREVLFLQKLLLACLP